MSGDEPVRTLPSGEFTVESWMAHLWADATNNEDDVFRYDDDAREIGEEVQLVPPEFAMVIANEGIGLSTEEILKDMGFNWESGVYHGEQGFKFHRPFRADVAYSVSGEVVDFENKEGDQGKFTVATLEYEITNPADDLVCETEKKIVLMG